MSKDADLIDAPYEKLVTELGLTTLERYSIDETIELREIPIVNIMKLKDQENCILIHQAIPDKTCGITIKLKVYG